MPTATPSHRTLGGFLSLKKIIRRVKYDTPPPPPTGTDVAEVEPPEPLTIAPIPSSTSDLRTSDGGITPRAIASGSVSNQTSPYEASNSVDPQSLLETMFFPVDERPVEDITEAMEAVNGDVQINVNPNVEEVYELHPISNLDSKNTRNDNDGEDEGKDNGVLYEDCEGGHTAIDSITWPQSTNNDDELSDLSQSIVPLQALSDNPGTIVRLGSTEQVLRHGNLVDYKPAGIVDELGLFMSQISSLSDEHHLQIQMMIPAATHSMANETSLSAFNISNVIVSIPQIKFLISAVRETNRRYSLLSSDNQRLKKEAIITSARVDKLRIALKKAKTKATERFILIRHMDQLAEARPLLEDGMSIQQDGRNLLNHNDKLTESTVVRRSNSQLNECNETIRRLEQTLRSEISTHDATKKQLKKSQDLVASLREQVQMHQYFSGELKKSRRRASFLESQLESQTRDNTSITTKLEDSRTVVTELRRQITDHKETTSQLKKSRYQVTQLKAQLETQQTVHETTSSKLADSRTLVTQLRCQLAAHEEKASELQMEKNRVIVQLKNQLNEHQERASQFQKARSRIKELNSELTKQALAVASSIEAHNLTKKKLIGVQSDLRSKSNALIELTNSFESLKKEKIAWQYRMDELHKVMASGRRVRMLDHFPPRNADRQLSSNIPRGLNNKLHQPSEEVLQAVRKLNQTVSEVADELALHFQTRLEGESSPFVDIGYCKVTLGDCATSIILHKRFDGLNRSFLCYIIRIFFVSWCEQIIEAWYPKQQSFSQLLSTALSSTSPTMTATNGSKRANTLGVPVVHTGEKSADLRAWSNDVVDHLLNIIPVPSLGFQDRNTIILPGVLKVVALSHKLRLALAEEDICGNLRLVIFPPAIPFDPNSMDMAGPVVDISILRPNIAGTIGIGLQSERFKTLEAGTSVTEVRLLLPPTVVLPSTLETAAICVENTGHFASAISFLV